MPFATLLPRPAVVLCAVVATVVPSGCRADGAGAGAVEPTTGESASQRSAPTVVPRARSDHARALEVLGDWDERRARALAAGDPAALRRLYVAGSPLLERDLSVLQRYADRGLVVTGLRQQVFSLEVRAADEAMMKMSVVERLARASVGPAPTAAAAPVAVPLPASRFTRRVLHFAQVDGAWRLSWAREG